MRTTNWTHRFKRDYKRESRKHQTKNLDTILDPVLRWLANDETLPTRYRDHALKGEWRDHRDCHILPDLVLIYRKPDGKTLELVRLGSHAELGL